MMNKQNEISQGSRLQLTELNVHPTSLCCNTTHRVGPLLKNITEIKVE